MHTFIVSPNRFLYCKRFLPDGHWHLPPVQKNGNSQRAWLVHGSSKDAVIIKIYDYKKNG